MSEKQVFHFELRRVMMYNHVLTAHYGKQTFECVAEDSPDSNVGLLVWPDDFGLDESFTQKLIVAFKAWAKQEGIAYTIREGPRC